MRSPCKSYNKSDVDKSCISFVQCSLNLENALQTRVEKCSRLLNTAIIRREADVVGSSVHSHKNRKDFNNVNS